jgi:hypothetical protein
MTEYRYDVHCGGAVQRPQASAVLRREMECALRKLGGWRWLAEVERMGYRPLWTTWEARPAGTLRESAPCVSRDAAVSWDAAVN